MANDLRRDLPKSTQSLLKYLKRVPPLDSPRQALSLQSFPIIALPFWLTPPANRADDHSFLVDLTYSTLNGYYGIRLLDNLMDADGPAELSRFAPCATYFWWNFARPYLHHFAYPSPFWTHFSACTGTYSDLTSLDAALTAVSDSMFETVSSKKFETAKVPVTAVALRCGHEVSVTRYQHLVDLLGRFHQFWNDLLDWRHDLNSGLVTFLQSKFLSQTDSFPNSSAWFSERGCSWACERALLYFHEAADAAKALECNELDDWFVQRERLLLTDIARALEDPDKSRAR